MLHQLMLMLSAGIAGLAMAVLVVFFADNGLNPAGRMVRCVMGFFVAVIWIMAIADEVVNVLQASIHDARVQV
jgi:sodium/potassium/calcium exchanger 6